MLKKNKIKKNKINKVLSPAIALAILAPAGYVPVAMAQAADIRQIVFTDTNDIIQTLVPSFNVSKTNFSGGAYIRPATLRGLQSDKTLVLVNSKRRHRSALVDLDGVGAQAPDMATIPSVAIGNIEVLRDGAAAQYGSDAIAGVINFILKENREGGTITVDIGEYGEGDGESLNVQGNIGLPLGDNGFISLSGEYTDVEATIRAEEYCETFWCADRNNPKYQIFNARNNLVTGLQASPTQISSTVVPSSVSLTNPVWKTDLPFPTGTCFLLALPRKCSAMWMINQ